jgi:hypothetical protein
MIGSKRQRQLVILCMGRLQDNDIKTPHFLDFLIDERRKKGLSCVPGTVHVPGTTVRNYTKSQPTVPPPCRPRG